jgi:hypothetical protein
MFHPIREIAHFMNWPNGQITMFCLVHELGRKWTKDRPVREMDKSRRQFMKWEEIWPVHEMGNFTDKV